MNREIVWTTRFKNTLFKSEIIWYTDKQVRNLIYLRIRRKFHG